MYVYFIHFIQTIKKIYKKAKTPSPSFHFLAIVCHILPCKTNKQTLNAKAKMITEVQQNSHIKYDGKKYINTRWNISAGKSVNIKFVCHFAYTRKKKSNKCTLHLVCSRYVHYKQVHLKDKFHDKQIAVHIYDVFFKFFFETFQFRHSADPTSKFATVF